MVERYEGSVGRVAGAVGNSSGMRTLGMCVTRANGNNCCQFHCDRTRAGSLTEDGGGSGSRTLPGCGGMIDMGCSFGCSDLEPLGYKGRCMCSFGVGGESAVAVCHFYADA